MTTVTATSTQHRLAKPSTGEFYGAVKQVRPTRLESKPFYISENVDCYQISDGDHNNFSSTETRAVAHKDVLVVFKKRSLHENAVMARKEKRLDRAKNRFDNYRRPKDTVFREAGGWWSFGLATMANALMWYFSFTHFSSEAGIAAAIFFFTFVSTVIHIIACFFIGFGRMMFKLDISVSEEARRKTRKLEDKFFKLREITPQFSNSDEIFAVRSQSQVHKLISCSDEVKEIVHTKLRSNPEVAEFDRWGAAVNNIMVLQDSLDNGFPLDLIPLMSEDAVGVLHDLHEKVSALAEARQISGGASQPMIEGSKATRAGAESFISNLGDADLKA